MKIWIDGAVREPGDARISVLDHGLLYGDGVFEGIRVHGGRVFRLSDHLRRLSDSARAVGLVLPLSLEAISRVVCETARALGEADCYLRLLVTRGAGELGVDPTSCREPQLVCIAATIALYPSDKLRRGIAMVTSSLRKPASDALDPRVKSLNYLNSVLAKQEARGRGADEALLLNAAGRVAEASVANVFIVRDGVLATPPVVDGSLDGITRASVLEIAAEEGIETRERSLSRHDLLAADELFLTGTGAGVVPVASLDGRPIGGAAVNTTGVRPVMERIAKAFPDFARRHGTPL